MSHLFTWGKFNLDDICAEVTCSGQAPQLPPPRRKPARRLVSGHRTTLCMAMRTMSDPRSPWSATRTGRGHLVSRSWKARRRPINLYLFVFDGGLPQISEV